MADEDLLREQNELLKALVCLTLEEQISSTEEKAAFLDQFDFTHGEIGEILDRDRSTISGYL
ncbi:hypothetical protein [Halosimplex marinum]|uniref:hypothetical protein n=1 Tax=Halosimplex marinum TaxID=3396620 RepID=UPI003F563844